MGRKATEGGWLLLGWNNTVMGVMGRFVPYDLSEIHIAKRPRIFRTQKEALAKMRGNPDAWMVYPAQGAEQRTQKRHNHKLAMTIEEANRIIDGADYVQWSSYEHDPEPNGTVCLDGWFTLEQIEAIAVVMRAASPKGASQNGF